MTPDFFNSSLYLERMDGRLALGSGILPPEAMFAKDAASTRVAASAAAGSTEAFFSIYSRRVVPGRPYALAAAVACRLLPRAAAAFIVVSVSDPPGRQVGLFCERKTGLGIRDSGLGNKG